MAAVVRIRDRGIYVKAILGVKDAFPSFLTPSRSYTPGPPPNAGYRARKLHHLTRSVISCSVCWHQTLRRPLFPLGSFLASDLLRVRKGTLIARYLTLFLTFLVSGLLHLVADLTRGISWQASGAISFFCTHAAGIMLEDAVHALLPPAAGHGWSSRCRKAIGYVFVLAFLLWSTPMWQYPSLSVDTGLPEDALLPFSVVRWFVGVEAGESEQKSPNL